MTEFKIGDIAAAAGTTRLAINNAIRTQGWLRERLEARSGDGTWKLFSSKDARTLYAFSTVRRAGIPPSHPAGRALVYEIAAALKESPAEVQERPFVVAEIAAPVVDTVEAAEDDATGLIFRGRMTRAQFAELRREDDGMLTREGLIEFDCVRIRERFTRTKLFGEGES